jgi:peptidoglycan/xylan/chitin deacetylase (PgdA/CDA1 family)
VSGQGGRARRALLRRAAPGGAILSLHSVTTRELPADGTAHVSLASFRSIVGAVRRVGELVTLGELVRRHQQGRSTRGLIALTFDDAYAALGSEFRDFVSQAGVPLAVFAVTAAAETGAAYWWDRVDDAFSRVTPRRWREFETACGLPEAYRRGQPREHGPLRPLRQWVLAAHRGRWPPHLEPALAALERAAGACTRHRSMTYAELAALAAVPGVEVGVHTVSHPVLPLLDDAELAREIADAHHALRERLPAVLPMLALPFGLYDERTLRAARAAGMTATFTVAGAPLHGQPLPHALPRYCLTRSDSPARLVLRLLGWPDRLRRLFGHAPAPYPDLPSPTT